MPGSVASVNRMSEVAQLREILKQRNAALRKRDETISQLREELSQVRSGSESFPAEGLIWIFGSARTGSTWLGKMLGSLPGAGLWSEPAIGAMVGEFYYERFPHRRGHRFLLADKYRDVWLRGIRSLVLDGVSARVDETLAVIQEPHGAIGAPILSEALPESRMVLLVRDPRDALSSAFDAERTGGWLAERRGDAELDRADRRDDFFDVKAQVFLWDLESACLAYRSHPGPKSIVRYEDLRVDTPATMRRLIGDLDLEISDRDLTESVNEHAWEAAPGERKGEGKFLRRATPGAWREDLTEEQQQTIEAHCKPVLDAFYDGEITLLDGCSATPPVARARAVAERLKFRDRGGPAAPSHRAGDLR